MRKHIRRCLSLLLVLTLLLGMVPAVAAQTGESQPSVAASFTDFPSDWSSTALEHAVENGLLNGNNGKIDPQGLLSRAQMAAVITRAFAAAETADLSGYTDVAAGAWYYEAMQKAVAMGVMTGDGSRLNPDAAITRQEAMTVLARAFCLSDGPASTLNAFQDGAAVANWAVGPVAAMVSGGYISGDGSGRLNPTATITRAEFAQVMDNMVKCYLPAEFDATVEGNAVAREAGTTLTGAQVTGTLVLADGVADTTVSLTDTKVSDRLVVRGGGTVQLTGTTTVGSLVVACSGGSVRLINETDTALDVTVRSDVVLEGTFGTVTVDTEGTVVTAAEGAVVDQVAVQADHVSVTGEGTVKQVQISDSVTGTDVTTEGTEIDGQPDAGTGETGKPGHSDEDNEGQIVVNALEDMTLTVGGEGTADVSAQPAGCTFYVTSSDELVATASLSEGVLTVHALAEGTAQIRVEASRNGYKTGTESFTVTVKEPEPEQGTITIAPLSPMELEVGASADAAVSAVASNGNTVTLSAVSGDPAVASVALSGENLTVTGVAQGETTITVTASAANCPDAQQSFTVTVKEPEPEQGTITIAPLPAMELEVGASADVTVSAAASNGNAVTLSAASGDPAVASVALSGENLTVTGVAQGETTITVTASAANCPDVQQSFAVTVADPAAQTDGRMVFNFNSGWMFSKGQGYNNSESNRADKEEVVVIPDTETPWATDYVMGDTWESVSLPHTYNDVDTFDNFTETGMNGERSVYGGTAWYKKTFTIPAEYEGKKVFLEFEAARQAAEVYVNGQKLEGKSENGFIPFGYDLTPYLNFGGENDITVMTDNSFPYYHIGEDGSKNELSWADSHWHPNNGGLYRNAYLYVTDPLHITLPLYSFLETQGTYVYTQNETDTSAEVVMDAEIQNEYDEARTFTYVSEVVDMDGKVVLTAQSEELTLEPGAKEVFHLTGTLDNPKRWSTEYPYLYEVVSKVLVDGKEVDSTTTPLGVRTFRFTNDSGFFLNENYVKLQGWGQKPTDEWAGLGAAYPDWMHAFTQELIKDAGGNFIRWGHCAGSPTQIAISDQYGIVTLQPGVDGEGSTVGGVYSELSYEVRKNAFRDMIIYYRNNPSIFLWELGNQSMPDEEAKALTEIVYTYDHHGMTDPSDKHNSGSYDETEDASNRLLAVRRGNSVMSKYVDVSVTTEGGWELKSDGKPGVEGEYNREEARRGVWDRYTPGFEDFKTPSGSSYNLTDEQFAVNQVSNYAKISSSDHSGGGNWIFSDSTSHGRVYSEVSRASGEVDAVRLPKEAYYTLSTIYTDETDVYLVGHWNYPEGTVKDVYATSDAASVKLVVTGENGEKTEYDGVKSNGYLFTFQNVQYVPGEATAIAYDKEGNEVGRSTKATHGEAVALRITPITGPQGLLANGSDILLLDVEAVDAEGNRCLTFDGTVNGLKTEFTINDDNGCSVWRGGYNSGIEHSTNNKYLYLQGGINRVAVRTTMKAGDITVTASTEGLESATITVTSQPVDNTGGLSTVMNEFKTLPLGEDPGVGDGEKPEIDDGTVTEQKSALMKESSYTGSDGEFNVCFPAIPGERVYSDEKDIVFGDLPIELLNSEYLQIPQADANLTGATDVLQLRFARDVDLYIAHDDTVQPRPAWITEGYTDTGMDITINGHTHSVFTKSFKNDESVTLFSNVAEDMTQGGNQYVVFVKEDGQETTFLSDNFEGQTVGEAPLGWVVNTAPDTSAKIVELDGNKALELLDTNTGSAPNMALVSRKFLPQSGKFAVEYRIYDYDLTAAGKAQDYVRILLHKGEPNSDPNVHDGTVVESYLRSNSTLSARYYEGSTRKDLTVQQLTAEHWYKIRYIVDMDNASYDIYVDDQLAKSGVKFRNNLDFVDHLILGSGGGSGTHVLIDDVKVELIDSALSAIEVNGAPLSSFDPDTTSYEHTLPFGTEQAPVVTATARDPYATVDITQPESTTGTATIVVTALNGGQTTYTVRFQVAGALNETLDDITLDGVSLKGFQSDTHSYEIVLAPEAEYPQVKGTAPDPSDEVVVTQATQENPVATLTVNGTGVYTISFTKAEYELQDDFDGAELSSVWTQNTSAATQDTATLVEVDGRGNVLNLADTGSTMLFVHGQLAHEYTTTDLAGKKIVLEWELNPGDAQQWIRGLFSKSNDCSDNNGKADMAVEVYTSVASKGAGDVQYKNEVDGGNVKLSPPASSGTVKNGQWNTMKLEVMPDSGTFRITVNGVSFMGDTDGAVRLNDGDQTRFSFVQFGTGGGATGTVQIDNVRVYVCSDID